MSHRILPQLIELHHWYQCKVCHSGISYNESSGEWYHLRGEPT